MADLDPRPTLEALIEKSRDKVAALYRDRMPFENQLRHAASMLSGYGKSGMDATQEAGKSLIGGAFNSNEVELHKLFADADGFTAAHAHLEMGVLKHGVQKGGVIHRYVGDAAVRPMREALAALEKPQQALMQERRVLEGLCKRAKIDFEVLDRSIHRTINMQFHGLEMPLPEVRPLIAAAAKIPPTLTVVGGTAVETAAHAQPLADTALAQAEHATAAPKRQRPASAMTGQERHATALNGGNPSFIDDVFQHEEHATLMARVEAAEAASAVDAIDHGWRAKLSGKLQGVRNAWAARTKRPAVPHVARELGEAPQWPVEMVREPSTLTISPIPAGASPAQLETMIEHGTVPVVTTPFVHPPAATLSPPPSFVRRPRFTQEQGLLGTLKGVKDSVQLRAQGLGEPLYLRRAILAPEVPLSQPGAFPALSDFSHPIAVERALPSSITQQLTHTAAVPAPLELGEFMVKHEMPQTVSSPLRGSFMPQKMQGEPRFAPLALWRKEAAPLVVPAKPTTIAEVAKDVAHACGSGCGHSHGHAPSVSASVGEIAKKSGRTGYIVAGVGAVAAVAALVMSGNKHRDSVQQAPNEGRAL